MEIGVCILPADVTLGLLQPRSSNEDSINIKIIVMHAIFEQIHLLSCLLFKNEKKI